MSARRTRLLLLAVLASAFTVPLGAVAATCAAGKVGQWTSTARPAFPSGSGDVVDYAVARQDPERVVVANTDSVLVSNDAGCHWTVRYQVSAPLPLAVVPRIRQVAMSAADPDTIYVALGADSAARPSLVRSVDAGKTWSAADSGLEAAVGRPTFLEVAPSDPRRAYLVLQGDKVSQGDTNAEASRTLWATTDGTSWTRRTAAPLLVDNGAPASVGSSPAALTGLAIDPLNPRILWIYGDFGVYLSTDDGQTSKQVLKDPTGQGGPIGAMDLYDTTRFRRVVAFDALAAKGYISFNSGASYGTVGTPGVVRSVVTGRRFDEVLIEVDGRLYYQLGADGKSVEITPSGPPVGHLQVALGSTAITGTPVFWASSRTGLLHWRAAPAKTPPGTTAPPPVVRHVGDLSIPTLPPLPPTVLQGPATVTVPAGGKVAVPYDLALPGVRRADLYFLVDVSQSMSDEISGLRSALAGIASDLVASGIDAHFGVARFNTYDSETYFRLLPISPPGKAVSDALGSLIASGGGTQKSQLEAIRESASGSGIDAGGAFVPPGQQAMFRPEAPVKIVLTATDEAFYTGPPSPTAAAVSAALRAAGVKGVGLAFSNGDVLPALPGAATPGQGLREIARGSGALAPPGGVDCDADGKPDLAAGAPLVCEIPSAKSSDASVLAQAIVNLVRSIPNRGTVAVTTSSLTATGSAIPVGPPFAVDFARYQHKVFPVVFRCPVDGVATSSRWDIVATSGGAPIARTSTQVDCRGAAPITLPPPAALAPALAVPVVQQPPSTTNVANPNPNPNPNPQGQPQAQGQPGIAGAHEDEPELAVAGSDVQATDELAMSRISWAAGALLLTGMACVTALRRRAGLRPAVAGRSFSE